MAVELGLNISSGLLLGLTGLSGWLGTRRLATYLHPFQQEEYNPLRFVAWWKEKKAVDRWVSVGLFMALSLTTWPTHAAQAMALGFATLWVGWRMAQEPNPTQVGPATKKPLVLTRRAQLTWLLASVLALPLLVLALAAPVQPAGKIGALIAYFQMLPLPLLLANALLWPLQVMENRTYLRECRTVLERLNPRIVGITGSFGKTSTKYLLNHILSAQSPVLMTPGSINTPLGIARVVREQLQPHHGVFLAEMGAYGPGSIARLCRLAPPKVSCITAVGEAHYERFKSLETVAKAKFEIAEATRKQGGVCVLNTDGIPEALWKPQVEAHPTAFRLVGSHKAHLRPGDVALESVDETPAGLSVTLSCDGKVYTAKAPLYGRMQAGNMAVAFAMALQLGMKPETIVAALKTATAAPHRLHVQRQDDKLLIDDSYNANPLGFRTALETLDLLAEGKHRRVLVTPGMVELGTLHAEAHREIAKLAAEKTDVILSVSPRRMPEFGQTLRQLEREGKYTGALVEVESLTAARHWLHAYGKPGDVVLLENDLPDRYEAKWLL